MIIPDQKRAVTAWAEFLFAAQGIPIPTDRILWGNQDANTTRPYCTVLYTGGAPRGNAPEFRGSKTTEGDARQYWQGTATLSFTFVGVTKRTSLDEDADSFASLMAIAVHDMDAGANLAAAGMSVQSVSELPAQDALTGQSQWETRASLDVLFNGAQVYVSSPGIVETVPVTGTTEPPTPVGTVEVTSTP